jgi:hypothetical protein
MKQAQADPWAGVLESCPAQSIVKGKVTRLADFGAFVEIAPGIERHERFGSGLDTVNPNAVHHVDHVAVPQAHRASVRQRAHIVRRYAHRHACFIVNQPRFGGGQRGRRQGVAVPRR